MIRKNLRIDKAACGVKAKVRSATEHQAIALFRPPTMSPAAIVVTFISPNKET